MAEIVKRIKNPSLPEFAFEWHPQSKKVWLVRLGPLEEQQRLRDLGIIPVVQGEVIAEHVEDHGRAIGFVQTWCRGFQEGLAAAKGREGTRLEIAPCR